MSEDVKPRQFFITEDLQEVKFSDGTTAGLSFEEKPIDEETFTAIELEPTLQLMDEMAKSLEQINKEEINSMRPGGGYSKSATISYEALEKYRKFKESLR